MLWGTSVFFTGAFALAFVFELVFFLALFGQFFLALFVSIVGSCQDFLSLVARNFNTPAVLQTARWRVARRSWRAHTRGRSQWNPARAAWHAKAGIFLRKIKISQISY